MVQYHLSSGRLVPSSTLVRSTYRGRRARGQTHRRATWNAVVLRRTHPYADELIAASKRDQRQQILQQLAHLQAHLEQVHLEQADYARFAP